MTHREKLRLLADIDAMIELRDMARQRDTRKGQYVVRLMDATIELARERLRNLGGAEPAAAAAHRRCAA